jgi:hypothetical protein
MLFSHPIGSRQMKRLTKPENLLNEQMLAMFEWASDHPNHRHNIG